MSFEYVNQVKTQYKSAILAKDHVVGIGTGYKISHGKMTDRECIVTLVRNKLPQSGLASESLIPQQLEGVPTDVLEVGDLKALQSPTERWRPAPGGVSIGHFRISAGTFGCVVRDREYGTRLILSNNHVLANSNDATIGDPILQPGPIDGGKVKDDTIGYLMRFEPIQFGVEEGTCQIAGTVAEISNTIAELLNSSHRMKVLSFNQQATNLIDAAVARPENDEDILDEIMNIGVVQGTKEAELGMAVRKMGRTTGFTTGTITVLNTTVNINYMGGKVATFENQIVSTAMSEGGDSGSLLVAGDELKAVGLLFAGSSQATIFNPIQTVLDILRVDL